MTHLQSGGELTAHDHHHSDLATILERDGRLVGAHLQEIIDWAGRYRPSPRMIVDLGAGTGTGTLRLAHTFPTARVVAVDHSPEMLAHVAAAADRAWVSERVSSVQADLDTTWPHLRDVDLVWAASSMHHLNDADRAFTAIREMLAPGGVVVVVEMDGLPRHLPEDLGIGVAGLEQRLHDAIASSGWNSHPSWSPAIRGAGLELLGRRTFTYRTNADPGLIMSAARDFLHRAGEGLVQDLPDADLETITHLLDDDHPHALSTRTDLTVRGSRTVWVGRKHP